MAMAAVAQWESAVIPRSRVRIPPAATTRRKGRRDMQLGALTDRKTPGQLRRRAARIARRAARRITVFVPASKPTKVRRPHRTFADLRNALFARGWARRRRAPVNEALARILDDAEAIERARGTLR